MIRLSSVLLVLLFSKDVPATKQCIQHCSQKDEKGCFEKSEWVVEAELRNLKHDIRTVPGCHLKDQSKCETIDYAAFELKPVRWLKGKRREFSPFKMGWCSPRLPKGSYKRVKAYGDRNDLILLVDLPD